MEEGAHGASSSCPASSGILVHSGFSPAARPPCKRSTNPAPRSISAKKQTGAGAASHAQRRQQAKGYETKIITMIRRLFLYFGHEGFFIPFRMCIRSTSPLHTEQGQNVLTIVSSHWAKIYLLPKHFFTTKCNFAPAIVSAHTTRRLLSS
jgi:hypothetical protein